MEPPHTLADPPRCVVALEDVLEWFELVVYMKMADAMSTSSCSSSILATWKLVHHNLGLLLPDVPVASMPVTSIRSSNCRSSFVIVFADSKVMDCTHSHTAISYVSIVVWFSGRDL